MRSRETVDLSIYARGVAVLARNPVIILFPLLGAVADIGLQYMRGPILDPLGGNDLGLFGLIVNLVYWFAFALAVIAAETAWRNRRPTLPDTWDEGKRKAGGIVLATIGMMFILFAAGMVGNFLGPLSILLVMAALYFLIYTIPAAAIGGVPGGAALQVSIERVRSNYLGAAVLAAVALLLYYYVLGQWLPEWIFPLGVAAMYVLPVIKAIVVAYLAVVFARQYDEVGFFRPY